VLGAGTHTLTAAVLDVSFVAGAPQDICRVRVKRAIGRASNRNQCSTTSAALLATNRANDTSPSRCRSPRVEKPDRGTGHELESRRGRHLPLDVLGPHLSGGIEPLDRKVTVLYTIARPLQQVRIRAEPKSLGSVVAD
jgi:hypothetical protein